MMAFAITLGVVLLLWYRNGRYDRVFAPVLFAVSLIQLIEFLLHTHQITASTGGWLQPLMLIWRHLCLFARTPETRLARGDLRTHR